MSISAIILTKNEEEMIGECIESVVWADEIIVVDGESEDKTRQIAQNKGAKVIVHPFKDFADQRNFALKQANCEWLIYVDADERVSDNLRAEILSTLSKPASFAAYRLRRKNFYFGKPWPYEEKLERLFNRKWLLGWRGELHESPVVKGKIGDMKGYLFHYTHRDLESMLEKTIEWSKIEAQLRFKAGHPPVTWWRLVRVAASGFFNSYICQRGFKVGTVGLIESIYQAYSMLITYARLWEIQNSGK